MLAVLTVALAISLPPIIEDPRRGPSSWAVVAGAPAAQPCGAAGFLLPLPRAVDQAWLEGVVALSACGAPLLALGGEPPPPVRPYLDGVVVEGWPAGEPLELARANLGLPLAVAVTDGAQAVQALAAGAAGVLVHRAPPAWQTELAELLPAPQPARLGSVPLPTALRAGDLALVVGLPAGFGGGIVHLDDDWVADAQLLGEVSTPLPLARRRGSISLELPALAAGGVLVLRRPAEARGELEAVTVTGARLPEVAELLARHQRAAARQERLLPRWTATQRLLVRVRVGELGRTVELELEGPVFFERGVGADWEIARAWLGGVAWRADRLPDLPLLEAERPPVPPLAVRLEPSWDFALAGVAERAGRECYLLTFQSTTGTAQRSGEACLDRATFGLVELVERATGLEGEVRATTQVTVNAPIPLAGEVVWLPTRVVADDVVGAFGTGTSVHRELTLTQLHLDPPAFAAERAAAYGGKRRMVRETGARVVGLVPDGQGGRVPEGSKGAPVRVLLAGVAVDPGLDAPVPFGGLQLVDFNFRGRGEQLRLLAAGVVNDVAWTRRRGRGEVSAGAFTQLLAFSNSAYRRGEEVPGEEVKVRRQRVNVGVARAVGRSRLSLDLELHHWDFGRSPNTAVDFLLPPDTWEGVLRGGTHTTLGTTSLLAAFEAGRRANSPAGGARQWQRYRFSVVHESTLHPLSRLTLAAEGWGGWELDRFSAPSPSRFGGLRLRGVPSNRVTPDRLGVVRAAVAVSVNPRLRGEVGVDAGWVWEERAGLRGEPLVGVGVGATLPGPWATLVELSLGYPLAVPGQRGLTAELLLLRPLGGRGGAKPLRR